MSYSEELTRAMTLLSQYDNVLFLGQQVEYPGTALFNTLKKVPREKRLELPVFEGTQLGMSIGLSLMGFIPVSIFPRFDFLVEALPRLVNDLDKLEEFTHGEYSSHIIIRTCVGSQKPLYPGCQHCQDYTQEFKQILKNVKVIKLMHRSMVVPTYMNALAQEGNYIIVEQADLYHDRHSG